MSTTIQIKRSTSGLAPNTAVLAEAELAYSQDRSNNGANAILYIESVNSSGNPVIDKVGGKYYTNIVDTATSSSTGSSLVQRDANGSFSANVVTATTFVGNVTGQIQGEAASAVIANTANTLTTGRYINLGGDLEGNVLFNGSQDVTIYANVKLDTITLGTDTTGDYVQNVIAGIGLQASGQGGEGASVTLRLANTAVTAGTYGGTTNVPVFTVDDQGRLTSATNATISTSFTIAGDVGSDTFNTGDTMRFIGTSPGIATDVTDNTISIVNTGVTNVHSTHFAISATSATGNIGLSFNGVSNIAGTANEIEVSAGSGNVTIGLPNDVTIAHNLTVGGNLVVSGNALIVSTTNLLVSDPLIHLANNNTASDVVDIGFEGHYYAGATLGQRHAGLFRDASDNGYFKFFSNVAGELQYATTVDTTNNGYSIATVVANLRGGNVSNLLNPIAVADGGTGRTSLTANAVLYGDGTNAVGMATGTAGQVLQIGTDGMVKFAGIDGGSY